MDEELKVVQEYYAGELVRYSDDRATTRLVATFALAKAARLLWPEAEERGAFNFLETIEAAIYEDDRRRTEGDEKKRGTLLNAHEIGLRVFCGGAYSLLRTRSASRPEKMTGTAAQRVVSEWTGGDVGPDAVRKYALDIGAVSTLGSKAKALESESGFISVSRPKFYEMIETATVNDLRERVSRLAVRVRKVRSGVESLKERLGRAR